MLKTWLENEKMFVAPEWPLEKFQGKTFLVFIVNECGVFYTRWYTDTVDTFWRPQWKLTILVWVLSVLLVSVLLGTTCWSIYSFTSTETCPVHPVNVSLASYQHPWSYQWCMLCSLAHLRLRRDRWSIWKYVIYICFPSGFFLQVEGFKPAASN